MRARDFTLPLKIYFTWHTVRPARPRSKPGNKKTTRSLVRSGANGKARAVRERKEKESTKWRPRRLSDRRGNVCANPPSGKGRGDARADKVKKRAKTYGGKSSFRTKKGETGSLAPLLLSLLAGKRFWRENDPAASRYVYVTKGRGIGRLRNFRSRSRGTSGDGSSYTQMGNESIPRISFATTRKCDANRGRRKKKMEIRRSLLDTEDRMTR